MQLAQRNLEMKWCAFYRLCTFVCCTKHSNGAVLDLDLLQGLQYMLAVNKWSITQTYSSLTLLVNFTPRATKVTGSTQQPVGSDGYLMTCSGRCREVQGGAGRCFNAGISFLNSCTITY